LAHSAFESSLREPLNDYPELERVFFPRTQKTWALRLLQALGWRLVFHGMPGPWGVVVVYPHTSNWDFPIAMLAKSAIGIQARFMAKDSLFKWPVFGAWLSALGGLAIDRSQARGVVAQMVEHFAACKASGELFWLGVAPEGTRKYQRGWKTGFYQIAYHSDVPVVLVRFDHSRKLIEVDQCIRLSGDMAMDFLRMAQAFDGVKGFHEKNASPIVPMPKGSS
jgi:1-acyl-sn-glycerol-3-phosphate acyltransferase